MDKSLQLSESSDDEDPPVKKIKSEPNELPPSHIEPTLTEQSKNVIISSSILDQDLEMSDDESKSSDSSDTEESSDSSDDDLDTFGPLENDHVNDNDPSVVLPIEESTENDRNKVNSWNLTKLFNSKVENKRSPSCEFSSNANLALPSSSRAAERRLSKAGSNNSKRNGSTVGSSVSCNSSDDSSDDDTPPPRPTPQIAAVPRHADRRTSPSSQSSGEHEASTSANKNASKPVPSASIAAATARVKARAKTVQPSVKILSAPPVKLPAKRGRPRKEVAKVAATPEINPKSREYLSTDDSTDSESIKPKSTVTQRSPQKKSTRGCSSNSTTVTGASKPSREPTLCKNKVGNKVVAPTNAPIPMIECYFDFKDVVKNFNKMQVLNKVYKGKEKSVPSGKDMSRVNASQQKGPAQSQNPRNNNSEVPPASGHVDQRANNSLLEIPETPCKSRKRKNEADENSSKKSKPSTKPRAVERERSVAIRSSNSRSVSPNSDSAAPEDGTVPTTQECRVPLEGEPTADFNDRQESASLNSSTTLSQSRENSSPLPSPENARITLNVNTTSTIIPNIHVNNCSVPPVRPSCRSYGTLAPPMASNTSCIQVVGHLEGKSIAEIFSSLFNCSDDNTVNMNHMFHMSHARKLKRDADEMDSDRTYQGTKYLEAVLHFILSGKAMETDSVVTLSAVTMYSDTIALITWVSSVFKCTSLQLNKYQLECNAKLAVLSLVCQCILAMKVFSMRQYEIRLMSTSLRHEFERQDSVIKSLRMSTANRTSNVSTGQPLQASNQASNSSNSGVGSTQSAAVSPPNMSPPTPSPASSDSSQTSQSSGYNTSNERRGLVPGNPHSATPSPSQAAVMPQEEKVEIPMTLYNRANTYVSASTFLVAAHEWFSEAQSIVKEHKLEGEFFQNLTICKI